MRLHHIALALALVIPGIASAGSCPKLMAEFDAALGEDNPEVDKETLEEAKGLREEGEALHAAGKHEESVQALNEALLLLEKR